MNPRRLSEIVPTLLLLALVITASFPAHAESKNIRLRNGIIPTEKKGNSARHAGVDGSPVSGLFLIQFTSGIQSELQAQLQQSRVRLLRFVPDDAFVARFSNVRLSEIEALPFVQFVEPYRAEYKVHSALRPNNAARGIPAHELQISALISPDATPQDLAKVRSALRKVEKETALRFGNILQGSVTPQQLDALAESPSVLWIEPAPKMKLFDEIASKITGGDDGEAGTPTITQQLGYDGTGITIAVADSGLHEGDAETMHPDLAGRVDAFFHYGSLTDAADEHSHGTHVTGIIAGDGATGEVDDSGYLYGLGVAPGSHIVAQRLFDADGAYEAPPSFEVMTHDAVRAGADIGSNSWGDDTQGRYDLSAAEFDELVRDADAGTIGDQQYILEFSAGNAGPGEQTIGSPAVAKNVIASGAVENNRFDLFIYDSGQETMADFSSRGPCEDGRIKPDVVAPGTWIAALRSSLANDDNAWADISQNYMYQGGTSQSGPHVSGAAAVFAQYYRETVTNTMPSPALVKAALINSAVDIDDGASTGPIPNKDEGWGRVDLTEIIGSSRSHEFVDQTFPLTNSQIFQRSVLVANADEPLKITLVYTDVPGFPAAIPALVNDLDLEVISPEGKIYRGNQFENGESVANAPSFDNINNVEAVHLFEPVPGEYIVRIHARNVVEDARRDTAAVDQDFALVVSADIPFPGVGILFFDKKSYRVPATMNLKLIDFNLAGQSSVNVLVKSSTEFSGEILTLNASGTSGAFTGSVATATGAANADGKIQISHSDIIEAIYQDTAPAGTRVATARADLFPPAISNVSVTNRFGRMIIRWQTDEAANGVVRFGTNSVLSRSATNATFETFHELALADLVGGMTYQFIVISADDAGNISTNNNNGALFSFVAVPPAVILLVDSYVDPLFSIPPISGYTDALDQVGLSYEFWDVASAGSPTFDDLKPFGVVIWRAPELFGVLSAAERGAISNYVHGGGSFLLASMEALTRLDESGGGAFRSNILQVASYAEDVVVPSIVGSGNDPITIGIDMALDYEVYDTAFQEIISGDLSDTIIPTTNATPILFESFPGEVVGLRYPRIGQDGNGRVIFLSFPLDAIPMTGNAPNNRVHLLRNFLEFLAPGVDGLGKIAFSSSAYTIPSLVTVEVADSDLKGRGQTTATFFSDTATEGQVITLNETPRPGLFRGYITAVAATNSFKIGELRANSGDTIRAEYFDASADNITSVTAEIDTIPATIDNITFAANYEDAIVEWTTSKQTDALVQFGESAFLGRTAYSSSFDTEHSVLLSGLQPDRVYYFQVTSRDIAGNATTDNNNGNYYTFRTLKPYRAPWSDDLETSSNDWEVVNGEVSATTWQLGVPNNGMESEAHSPTKAWGSNLNGNNIDSGETILASPAIEVTGEQATLRFWHSYDFTERSELDIYEFGVLLISTNNGNAWIDPPAAEFVDSSFGWEEATIDLTPYIGKVIRIGFMYAFFSFEGGNHPGWLIDDISITGSNAPSQFAFKSVAITNNQAHLTFVASPGIYVIEASTDLINWTRLQTNTATGGTNIFIDIQSPNFDTRFYRLRR